MKKLFAMLLALSMLLAASAGAESLPYMEQQLGTDYRSFDFLMTAESCTEVCLTPYNIVSMYGDKSVEPIFLLFPSPENARAYIVNSAHTEFVELLSESSLRKYTYELQEDASCEAFLSACSDPDMIVADGSEGYAVYLDGRYAKMLIPVDEMNPGVGLKIELALMGMVQPKDGQDFNSMLTEWALGEAQRIVSSMKVERMDTYWTASRYQGVLMRNPYLPDDILKYTAKEMPKFNGMSATASFIAHVDESMLGVAAFYGDQAWMEIMAQINDWSSTVSLLESDPDLVCTIDLPDGTTYYARMFWYDSPQCTTAIVSRPIGNADGSDMYLNLELSIASEDGKGWASEEDFKDYFTQFAACFEMTK